MIGEVAINDAPEPFPLVGDRLVHAPLQLLLDLLELRPHAVCPALPLNLEFAGLCFAADEGEAQEAEGLRLAEPTPFAALGRKATELDKPGLLRVQRERELPQPLAHRVEEAPGVALVLRAHNEVVGIAHDDHVARGLPPSPALGPEVEGIVQVDVGEERRDHRSLPRPLVAPRNGPFFQYPRPEPVPDQADDAPVADPVFQEAHQPLLADLIEERPDVGVENPAHLPAMDADAERIERVMRSAPRSEPV